MKCNGNGCCPDHYAAELLSGRAMGYCIINFFRRESRAITNTLLEEIKFGGHARLVGSAGNPIVLFWECIWLTGTNAKARWKWQEGSALQGNGLISISLLQSFSRPQEMELLGATIRITIFSLL